MAEDKDMAATSDAAPSALRDQDGAVDAGRVQIFQERFRRVAEFLDLVKMGRGILY